MASRGEEWCLGKILRDELRMVTTSGTDIQIQIPRGWVSKKPNFWRGRARFTFNSGKTTHTVYRNRLIWMITHRELIPDTHYVDHVNEDRGDDQLSNLQLHSQKDSHQQGNSLQTRAIFYRLCCWFEFIVSVGRSPVSDEELETWENNWGKLT